MFTFKNPFRKKDGNGEKAKKDSKKGNTPPVTIPASTPVFSEINFDIQVDGKKRTLSCPVIVNPANKTAPISIDGAHCVEKPIVQNPIEPEDDEDAESSNEDSEDEK